MGRPGAQAIARGPTRLGIGSAPRTIRASISSFKLIEPSSAASPAPIRLATSTPARTGPISTTTATARKLGSADSAPWATRSRCVWIQATRPTLAPAPSMIGRLLTATCSNCQTTSPVRLTSTAGMADQRSSREIEESPELLELPHAMRDHLAAPRPSSGLVYAIREPTGDLRRNSPGDSSLAFGCLILE